MIFSTFLFPSNQPKINLKMLERAASPLPRDLFFPLTECRGVNLVWKLGSHGSGFENWGVMGPKSST